MDPTPPAPPPPITPLPPPEHQQQQDPTPPVTSQPPLTTTTTTAAAITPTTLATAITPTTLATASSSLPAQTAATTAPTPPPIIASSPSNPNNQIVAAVASSSQLSLPPPPTTSLSTNPQTTRPPYNRPWQQQPSPFSHYSLPPPPPLRTVTTNPSSPALTGPPQPRGGMAIGVPATPPTPSTSFSSLNPSSFGQPFSGLGRNVTDSGPASSSSQVRQPIGGMQGIGMMGSLGSSSAMRPQGIPGNPMRPAQFRPQPIPSTHSPAAQNFQGHGMLRVPSVGSPGSPSPNSTQSPQLQNQPWLSSGPQGKHHLSATSLRPQLTSLSMAQRSHISQQHHHSISATSQQQHASTTQQSQQPQTSSPPQEPYGQQFLQSRTQQSLPSQHQISRPQGLGIQRPQAVMPSPAAQAGVPGRTASAEPEEPCKRILSKRSIQELVAQVDPSEKLDPEVEDILVDIADDFVESVTAFGCSLAKHRKSNTLEAKDILLHLERNWNINLPGFGGDEIKMYKKPPTSDIHKERLATIKKSMAAEVTNSKSSGGNPKSHHLAKVPTSFVGSPSPRLREHA